MTMNNVSSEAYFALDLKVLWFLFDYLHAYCRYEASVIIFLRRGRIVLVDSFFDLSHQSKCVQSPAYCINFSSDRCSW